MKMAGEPGDRWLRLKKWRRKAAATKLKWEESPDTVERHAGHLRTLQGEREMAGGSLNMGNAPDNVRGRSRNAGLKPGATTASRKVPQRIDRRRSEHGGIAQVNLRDADEMRATLGKGEKVG